MEKIAIYAGTFDPPTNGHRFAVEWGRALFDKIIMAIGENPDKKPMFGLNERLEMMREEVGAMQGVEIDHYSGLYAVDYAQKRGAGFLLRGIRDINDFGYETSFQNLCYRRNRDIKLVYAIPPHELTVVSSSTVKGLVGYENWESLVAQFVSRSVLEKLKEKSLEIGKAGR